MGNDWEEMPLPAANSYQALIIRQHIANTYPYLCVEKRQGGRRYAYAVKVCSTSVEVQLRAEVGRLSSASTRYA